MISRPAETEVAFTDSEEEEEQIDFYGALMNQIDLNRDEEEK